MITGQAKSIELDQNGNILVTTEYTLTDGTKKIGGSRYDAIGFSLEKATKDIQQHCETLMRATYNLKQNQQTVVDIDIAGCNAVCESLEIVAVPEIKDKDGIVIQEMVKITIDDRDDSPKLADAIAASKAESVTP
jgi:hypothetical protein